MFSCLKPPVLQKFLKIISGLLLDESAKYRHGLMGICCYLGKICIFAVTVNISQVLPVQPSPYNPWKNYGLSFQDDSADIKIQVP